MSVRICKWACIALTAAVVALVAACPSVEPPGQIGDEIEGVFIEAPGTPPDLAMYRGGSGRTGVYYTEGVLETPEVKWVFQTDRAIQSSAVVIDDKVLFGSDNGDFYALDAETGTTVWTFDTGTGQVRTSPLVADGVVYFGADDGYMRALTLDDGEELWDARVGMVRSSPVISHGTIFFGSDTGLHARDARTGLLRWDRRPEASGHLFRPPPAVIGDTVFSASGRFPVSILLAMDRSSGDEVWSYPLEGWDEYSIAARGGAVFVATSEWIGRGSRRRVVDGRVYAIDQNSGELRWLFHDEEAGVHTSPAVTEDLVIVGMTDGRLEALDIQTGEVEWVFESGSWIGPSPTVADGLVYFGTLDGKVWAVDIATGQKKWVFQTDVESENCRTDTPCGRIANEPVISDGVLYVGNGAGYFYALESLSR